MKINGNFSKLNSYREDGTGGMGVACGMPYGMGSWGHVPPPPTVGNFLQEKLKIVTILMVSNGAPPPLISHATPQSAGYKLTRTWAFMFWVDALIRRLFND